MKRFRCVTFGCRVNQYETQAIREQLEAVGLSEAAGPEPAEIVVLNSCTVTAEADRQCLSELRSLRRANPGAHLIVTGCLVQRDAERLAKVEGVRLLAGPAQKHRIGERAKALLEGEGWQGEPRVEAELGRVYAPLAVSRFDGFHKAFVKVQDGCDRACAFCKIPLVRGRSRSRPLEEVTAEVQRLVENGFQEVVLTGIAIGLWGRELKPEGSLPELVRAVDRLPGSFRIRLSSLDPRDLDEPLIRTLEGSSRVCRHLHLSLQSGSDPVLARMNRGYTAAEYAAQVAAVRRFWPDLGLTTDLIAGFPGETDRQFRETLDFFGRMEFAKVHVFPYSRRRGTSAWVFKEQEPPPVVRERARLLRRKAEETAARFRRRLIGTLQEALVEEVTPAPGGGWTAWGYLGSFVRVGFEGRPEWAGRLVPLRLEAHFFPGTLDKMTQCTPHLGWEDNFGAGTSDKG